MAELGHGAYSPQKYVQFSMAFTASHVELGTDIEVTNDRFEIDIIMWALGTRSQSGKSQSAEFARAFVKGNLNFTRPISF